MRKACRAFPQSGLGLCLVGLSLIASLTFRLRIFEPEPRLVQPLRGGKKGEGEERVLIAQLTQFTEKKEFLFVEELFLLPFFKVSTEKK